MNDDGIGARLFVALQYLLPQHGLSRLVHALARVRVRWIKNALIRAFMRAFKPDLADAVEKDPALTRHSTHSSRARSSTGCGPSHPAVRQSRAPSMAP